MGRRWTGVADVTHGLSRALVRKGHEVRVIMASVDANPMVNNPIGRIGVPFNGQKIELDVHEIKSSDKNMPDFYMFHLPVVNLVDVLHSEENAPLVEKRLNLFFDRASVALLEQIGQDFDIAHAHTGVNFFGYFAKSRGLKLPVIYTAHLLERGEELGFLGHEFSELTDNVSVGATDQIDPYVYAFDYADRVITVSQRYAQELRAGRTMHAEYRQMLERNQNKIDGVLNGLDESFDADKLYEKRMIPQAFGKDDLSGKEICHLRLQERLHLPQDPNIPIMLWSQRLVESKGLVEFAGGGFNAMMKLPMQLIVFGRGNATYESMLAHKASVMPHQIRFVRFSQFNSVFEPLFIAGSDIVALPSLEEPCGLLSLKAMRLGTLPIVRPVGGLAEIVRDGHNGFVIPDGESIENDLGHAMIKAYGLYREDPVGWREMQCNAMAFDSTWDMPADKYIQIYRSMVSSQ